MYVPEDRLRLFWVAQMRSIQCFSIKLGHVSPSYCLGRYIPDSLESGLRSTRGVHLAGSDDVACKIVQNHLPGGLKM